MIEGIRARLRRTSGEERVFGFALAALAVHVVTDALIDDTVVRALGAIAAIALAPALFAVFLRRGRLARTLLAGVLGAVATAVGLALYAAPVALAGVSGSDYTGLLLTAAGLVLVGLAFRVALRGRRRRIKLVAIPVLIVVLVWVIFPALFAGIVTSAPHPTVADARTLGLRGARDVTFMAADGVRLAGWYVPGRNGAAVVLMHGSHNSRADTLRHLRLVVAAGYAALAYDARGHGRSGGQTNALGWHADPDVTGAVQFLRRQHGVDPNRIAALGLSMGAEEALRAAADGVPLRAVMADGAGASTLGDMNLTSKGPLAPVLLSATWLSFRATELISGDDEPAPLKHVVGRIRVPVLLIASVDAGERKIDDAYRARIGDNATLWYVPDAGHTKALVTHPQAYAARVSAFLATALGS
jgi:pimeloyl-ACP methyl ester carboxylesterase